MKNQRSLVQKGDPSLRTWLWLMGLCAAVLAVPDLALAASPFTTGATATSTSLLAILTPIAVIAVMAGSPRGLIRFPGDGPCRR